MVQRGGLEPNKPSSTFDFFNQIKLCSHMLQGVTDATMSHGEAWHFARIGRLIERADKTSRILDVKYFVLLPNVADVGTPLDSIQWAALLKSASALEMYRRRHGRIVPAQVADFLMLDRHFPRAMHFCLIKAAESLHDNHRQSQRHAIARRPNSIWADCGRSSTMPALSKSSSRLARIHRPLSVEAELGRRGDFPDVLRRIFREQFRRPAEGRRAQ